MMEPNNTHIIFNSSPEQNISTEKVCKDENFRLVKKMKKKHFRTDRAEIGKYINQIFERVEIQEDLGIYTTSIIASNSHSPIHRIDSLF